MKSASGERFILVVKCPDTKGIIAAVSEFPADNDASIAETSHFSDTLTASQMETAEPRPVNVEIETRFNGKY